LMSKQTQSVDPRRIEARKNTGVIRGAVKYPLGPVRGATVTANENSALSDDAGNYEISSLDAGSYTVEAEAPFPGYEAAPQEVEIGSGETKVVDIYFEYEKAAVEGYVYDSAGKPIADASLSGVLYGNRIQVATTDQKGYFKFEKVSPGGRFMRVNALGFMSDTKDFAVKKEGVTTVEFRLQPASCRIYGIVTDENSKPIQAKIILHRTGIVLQKVDTDAATGSYELAVVPGTYEVNVVAMEYQPRAWHGSVSADIRIDFSLSLAPEQPPDDQTW
jgi:hypothetical protein